MINNQLNLFESEKDNKTILCVDNYENNPAVLKDIPYDKIYESARKEASRKKPAFFIHKYFARRITSSFRMMIIGSLLNYNESIWNNLYKSFDDCKIGDFTILDPFMGGGTTLFEASRLNIKAIGADLQPLSKLVTTALLKELNVESLKNTLNILDANVADKIMKYQKTICPTCGDDADIMYTFHVKKVKTNSTCKEHMLFSSFVLAFKNDIFTLICPKCGGVCNHNFKKDGEFICPDCGNVISNPKDGYVKRGVFSCPDCKETQSVSKYKKEDGYPFDTKIIAIEYYCPHCKEHGYKRIDEKDINIFEQACEYYDEIKESLPIPKQQIPEGYNTNQIRNHGYNYFYELFNKRQLLGLGLLQKSINEIEDENDKFWLQIAFSGMLEMNNMFCRYQANASKICNIFFNHAYVPITMPVENNVWGTKLGTGTFLKTINKVIRAKKFCGNIYDIYAHKIKNKIIVDKIESQETVKCKPVNRIEELDIKHPYLSCGDSRDLSFIRNESINMVLTDPPFGANVMYSELIDFFHVWNYNSDIGKKYGFLNPYSPKKEEIIINSTRNITQCDYQKGLHEVFSECHRVLKERGLLIFSFHDKSIESWKSMLESVYNAGFKLIRAYPLHAETRTGAHTSNKNSIALDIMLIYEKLSEVLLPYQNIDDKYFDMALEETGNIISRLENVDAEITIPDIQNIFISQLVCILNANDITINMLFESKYEKLNKMFSSIDSVFSNITITDKRSGWWSELYKEKWNI